MATDRAVQLFYRITAMRDRSPLTGTPPVQCRHGQRRDECHQCSPRVEPATAPVLPLVRCAKRVTTEKPIVKAKRKPGKPKVPRKPARWELLMEVARCIAFHTDGTFSEEKLAVVAASFHPEHFAMREYPLHPDTNRVRCELVGQRGLVKRGLLVRDGKRLRVAR